MGAAWNYITADSQLRWTGPEKGIIHLATAAVVNALWDMYARQAQKPLWRLICDMTPEELAQCIPYRWISDVLTYDEVVTMLKKERPHKEERIHRLEAEGYPAYTTSVGWFGAV